MKKILETKPEELVSDYVASANSKNFQELFSSDQHLSRLVYFVIAEASQRGFDAGQLAAKNETAETNIFDDIAEKEVNEDGEKNKSQS